MAFIMANKGFWVSSGAPPSVKKGGMERNHVKNRLAYLITTQSFSKIDSERDVLMHSSSDLPDLHSSTPHSL